MELNYHILKFDSKNRTTVTIWWLYITSFNMQSFLRYGTFFSLNKTRAILDSTIYLPGPCSRNRVKKWGFSSRPKTKYVYTYI